MLRKNLGFVLLLLIGCLYRSPAASAQIQWVDTFQVAANAQNQATSIATGPTGDLYVAGFVTGFDRPDLISIAVNKYSSSGGLQWESFYAYPHYQNLEPQSIQVNAAGDAFVVGTARFPDYTTQIVTLKFSGTNGLFLWASYYKDPSYAYSSAVQLRLDAAGNIYVCDTGFHVLKYSPDGALIWDRHFFGSGEVFPNAMIVDATGNVYLTGTAGSGIGDQDYVTVKYDTNGNLVWYHRFNGPSNTDDYAYDIALDSAGYVYVTGELDSDVGPVIGTLKYDNQGHLIWARRFGEIGTSYGTGNAFAPHIAIDTVGNVVVACSQYEANESNLVVVKYDPDGSEIWHQRYDKGTGHSDTAQGLAIDSADNILVTASSDANIVTLKYRPDAVKVWSYTYTGAAPAAIALGLDDSVYVGGYLGVIGSSQWLLIQYAP